MSNPLPTSCVSFLREFIAQPLRQVDAERREYLLGRGDPGDAWRASAAMFFAAVFLTLRYYQPSYLTMHDWLAAFNARWPNSLVAQLLESAAEPVNVALARYIGWSLWQFVAYVVGPVLVVRLLFRRRLSDYGAKLRGVFYCWPAYVVMYLLLLPAVLLVSTTERFQHTYPFLKPEAVATTSTYDAEASIVDESGESAGRRIPDVYWPRFWIWQAFYALQFVSLEFFFRGFLLHALRRPLGAYSILVMTIPYCMIHFGKPPAETLGAIVAGVLLGFMSLKTRSIWLGAALHISVALTMDLAALAQ